MVYGNTGDLSGTGVLFTRNPNTGEKTLYGEYLVNAQGEDVVAGIRNPQPIEFLKHDFPEAYGKLLANVALLERTMKDMQDIEWTIENNELFMLQTRTGKRSGLAAINIALAMKEEKLISEDEAIMMVKPSHLQQLLHPQFSDVESLDYKASILCRGLPASGGAAVGRIVFTPEAAVAAAAEKRKVILVREDTSPEGTVCTEITS